MKVSEENILVLSRYSTQRANKVADKIYSYLSVFPSSFDDKEIQLKITTHKDSYSHEVDYFLLQFSLPPSYAYCAPLTIKVDTYRPIFPSPQKIVEQLFMLQYISRFYWLLTSLEKRNQTTEYAEEKVQLFCHFWQREIVAKDISRKNMLDALYSFLNTPANISSSFAEGYFIAIYSKLKNACQYIVSLPENIDI